MNNLLPSLIYDVPFIVEPVVYLAPGITHAALHISRTALGSGGVGGCGLLIERSNSPVARRSEHGTGQVTCQYLSAEIVSSIAMGL